MRRALYINCLAALAMGSAACTAAPVGTEGGDKATSSWSANIDRVNQVWCQDWDGNPCADPINNLPDAYNVKVKVGDTVLNAPTHLFDLDGDNLVDDIVVIPYDDTDQAYDADGNLIGRGDAVLAEYFPPGTIGYAIKHHRPEHRLIDLNDADSDALKEDFKLQDTHIEIVIGVENRLGERGVITLNNPQGYPGGDAGPGRFGDEEYSMVFVRPVWPANVSASNIATLEANIRLMALGFNAVTEFPGDYNGGDPLAARDPEEVREHVAMMIRAIAGDDTAREWFMDPDNLVYCAELAHLSTSAGILVPLNKESVMAALDAYPLAGAMDDEKAWNGFSDQVAAFSSGNSNFTKWNGNPQAAFVDVPSLDSLEGLRPLHELSGAAPALAFAPMTMADIVQQFMRTHLPRQFLGETLALPQASVLLAMKPGLFDTMGLTTPFDAEYLENLPPAQLEEMESERAASLAQVDGLFNQIVAVVATNFDDCTQPPASALPGVTEAQLAEAMLICDDGTGKAGLNVALEPYMAQARAITGPRGEDSGEGLFVPPSLFHIIAQGDHTGGALDVVYVGHGVHFSMVSRVSGSQPPLVPVVVDDPDLDEPGFCQRAMCAPGTMCVESRDACVPVDVQQPPDTDWTPTSDDIFDHQAQK